VFLPTKFPADLGRAVLRLYAPEGLGDKGEGLRVGIPPIFSRYSTGCLWSDIVEDAVYFPIIGRLLEISVADTELLAGLTDGFPLAEQNLGSSELVDDLFGGIPFLRHGSDLLMWLFTTFDLDQLFRAMSQGHMGTQIPAICNRPVWSKR
jgi:hypothetical protein